MATKNFSYKSPNIEIINVYYTGEDALKVGYLLCPDQDATTNVDGDTVDEGDFNNGRFKKYEKPTTANIPYGPVVVMKAMTGPGWVQVAVPNGGHVQVYADFSVTIGDTLYCQNGSYLAGTSGVAGIGKAIETIDRSVTNGLCGMKFGHYAADLTSAEASINTRASNVEASDASMKLVYDSVSASAASMKLVYDSVSASASSILAVQESIDTVLSTIDSTATAVTSADTALSTVGSQVVAILDALKAIE